MARLDMDAIHELNGWIIKRALGASLSEYQKIFPVVYDRLMSAGVPLKFVNTAYATLHPLMAIVSLSWSRETGSIGVQFHRYDANPINTEELAPFQLVLNSKHREVRVDPREASEQMRCPYLRPFAESDTTDLICFKVAMSNEMNRALRSDDMLLYWTTDVPERFSDAELEAIRLIQTSMSVVFKLANRERLSLHILNAYLGEKSGQQVLDGNIRLGDGQNIPAVIWFSDLRGSTPLSERLPPQAFLDLLNDYFEALAGSIVDEGGEVLRFIGDAALAIFPIGDGAYMLTEARSRALAAARLAKLRAEEINARRERDGLERFEYGIGLHVGDIMYGNIGIPNRLEFSVIGPAANQAAGVEGLCKELGETILVSDTFASEPGPNWRSLGTHQLRGIERDFEIFAPAA